MASSEQKELVQAVIRFLQDTKSESTRDSLDAAIDCLTQAFEVEPSSASASPSLLQIWREGTKALTSSNQDATSNKDQELSSDQLDQDCHFQEFVALLRQKGYFASLVEGSPEWTARLNKAKREFRKRPPKSATPSSTTTLAAAGASSPIVPSPVTPVGQPQQSAPTSEARAESEKLKLQGNELMAQSKHDEAVECYTRAIGLTPDVAIFYNNRAAAFTHLKRYDEAIEDCNVAIRLDPRYAKAYSRLGTVYFFKGEFKLALENGYRKAAELDPNNDVYRRDIAKVQEKINQIQTNATANRPSPAAAAGGMPDFSSMFGSAGGAGGMPNFADIMNNPAIMQMAQQMMSDPSFMDMMNNVMPGMSQAGAGGMPDFSNLRNMMQGMTSNSEGDEAIFDEIRSDPEFAGNPRFQQVIDELRNEGPSAAMRYLGDPEVALLMQKVAARFFEKRRASATTPPNNNNNNDNQQ